MRKFIGFTERLWEDFQNNGERWENGNLSKSLGGLHGFTVGMEGYYRNMGQPIEVEGISLRVFAEMLLTARVYE